MKSLRQLPIALTIAGSDSGGGAGIQADLKTFAALGVHGTSVITCITAQNPTRVTGVEPCSTRIVTRQIEAIFAELPPAAIKTGMLLSARIIRAVADALRDQLRQNLVLDPVMVATSGARLLEPTAIRTLLNRLFPLAQLVTPNLHEAELLCERKLTSVEHLREAARLLHRRFGIAALVKGGHLRGLKAAIDIFYDGKEELLLSAPFVKGVSTHGTGCTYSAAITAHLAKGATLATAISRAKVFITGAIAHSQQAAEHSVLNTRWR